MSALYPTAGSLVGQLSCGDKSGTATTIIGNQCRTFDLVLPDFCPSTTAIQRNPIEGVLLPQLWLNPCSSVRHLALTTSTVSTMVQCLTGLASVRPTGLMEQCQVQWWNNGTVPYRFAWYNRAVLGLLACQIQQW